MNPLELLWLGGLVIYLIVTGKGEALVSVLRRGKSSETGQGDTPKTPSTSPKEGR